jgi:hypothetical protein
MPMVRINSQTVRAFFIAPLIVPVVCCLPLPGRTFPRPVSAQDVIAGILFWTAFALPIAYCAELVLGMPAWLVFKYYHIRSFAAFAVGGAFLGLLVFLIMGIFGPALFELRYLSVDVVGSSGSAIFFRTIVFSAPPQERSK